MFKNKTKEWMIIISIILIILLFIGSCNRIKNIKNDLSILEQNKKALSDSLRITKNKVGDLESSINILVSKKNDLKNLSNNLAEELKKEKGEVYQLNEIIANFKPEIIEVPIEIIEYDIIGSNKAYGLLTKYDTIFDKYNYNKLEIESKFLIDTNLNIKSLGGIIKNNEVGFSLVTGLREKDGNIEIFARSPHPYLSISNMEGAIINPKKHPVIKKFTKPKRWGIGVFGGFGVGGDKNGAIIGPFIGVGLNYNFILM